MFFRRSIPRYAAAAAVLLFLAATPGFRPVAAWATADGPAQTPGPWRTPRDAPPQSARPPEFQGDPGTEHRLSELPPDLATRARSVFASGRPYFIWRDEVGPVRATMVEAGGNQGLAMRFSVQYLYHQQTGKGFTVVTAIPVMNPETQEKHVFTTIYSYPGKIAAQGAAEAVWYPKRVAIPARPGQRGRAVVFLVSLEDANNPSPVALSNLVEFEYVVEDPSVTSP